MSRVPGDSGDGPADGAELSFPEANAIAVTEVAGVLGSTLGPAGREKLLLPDDDSDPVPGVDDDTVLVTADGATILEALPIAHPLAPVLRRVAGPEPAGDADVEGAAIPEGITTRIVLAGAILDAATERLDRGLHPRTLTAGLRRARRVGRRALAHGAVDPASLPDPRAARLGVARTAMTGTDAGPLFERGGALALAAVDAVGLPDELSLSVVTTPSSGPGESRLVRGTVLDRDEPAHRDMPRTLSDAAVLVVDGSDRGGLMERDPSADVTLAADGPVAVADERAMRHEHKDDVVAALQDCGVDMVATRLGIDEGYQRRLADRGILGVRAVSRLKLRRLAAATGARIVLDVADVDRDALGTAGSVVVRDAEGYPRRGAGRTMIVVEDCPEPAAVTLLVTGLPDHPAERARTQLRKAAVSVALADGAAGRDGGVLAGGGGAHLGVASAVRAAARSVGRREQLAMGAYADGVERTVGTLAANAGLDERDAVSRLRAAIREADGARSLSLPAGEIVDPFDAGLLDPARVVRDQHSVATDLACLVLGVDDTIDAAASDPDGGA